MSAKLIMFVYTVCFALLLHFKSVIEKIKRHNFIFFSLKMLSEKFTIVIAAPPKKTFTLQ